MQFALSMILMIGTFIQGPIQRLEDRKSYTTLIAEAIGADDAGWKYVAGICTCPKLVEGQKIHDVGSWQRVIEGKRQIITIDVYVVSSVQEASDWMGLLSRGEIALACGIDKVELSEEGLLLTCPQSHHYEVYFRKGAIIISVSGDDRADVERFVHNAFKLLNQQ